MNYIWKKELIEGNWYSVCENVEHVPMIKWNHDGTYSVTGSDGKPRTEKEFNDAKKFAIQTLHKMKKFNRKFDK